jgi:hypothetical protein
LLKAWRPFIESISPSSLFLNFFFLYTLARGLPTLLFMEYAGLEGN